MDNLIDLKKGEDDAEYKPEPRDILTVVQDFVRGNGVHTEIPEGQYEIDIWTYVLDTLHLEYKIEGEYTDILKAGKPLSSRIQDILLHVEDNTFSGVIFRKGSIKELEEVFLKVKEEIQKQGGTF